MAFEKEQCLQCRRDFPALAREFEGAPLIFLDGPAGTQVPRQVIDVIRSYYETSNANVHGFFPTSRETDELMFAARETMAAFLGALRAGQISFGQNMTSLTFSLSHALAKHLEPGDEVVITRLDHEANRGPWLGLQRQGIVVREIGLQPDASLDVGDFARKITEKTRLVALGMASNAFGTVNDIGPVRDLCEKVGAYLFLDAVHYAPHFPLDFDALGADFLVCSPYKFYGPHMGVLCSREGLLDRFDTDRLCTQEQEAPYRVETGTLNHAAVAGVLAAIEYIASWGTGESFRDQLCTAMEGIHGWEHRVARYYYDRVREIPGVTTYGQDFSALSRAPTVAITIDGMTSSEAARRLGERGVQVWDGHFYAIRAIESLGLAERGGVIRTGVSMYTTPDDIDRLLAAVAEIAG